MYKLITKVMSKCDYTSAINLVEIEMSKCLTLLIRVSTGLLCHKVTLQMKYTVTARQ